ncbi:ankyrin repeat domain-containing protein [Streptomyces sp. Act143]|uniref:ankyrin repeat domain-containing protein n=1 Tax=Streptomyces sp. Act143 TaxID=2200760 RepID=UPI00215A68CD|nr:ankyrin repeat domain-containing protein [Streptomyces sp. Act143]
MHSTELTDLVDNHQYVAALEAIQRLVATGTAVDEIRDTRYSGDAPLWVRMLDEGQSDVAEFAIQVGADPNGRFINRPAVLLAAKAGFHALVAALAEHGADVNARNDDGRSALHEAAQYGHIRVVDVLLGSGAEVDSVDRWGHTPLMIAAVFGGAAVLRRLVMAGADPKVKDRLGNNALTYATKNNNQDGIDYLSALDAGKSGPE